MLNRNLFVYSWVAPFIAFFSTSTLLRFGQFPFGIAEVLVLGGLVYKLKLRGCEKYICSPFILFWLGFLIILFLGYIASSAKGGEVLHTSVAYCFNMLFTLCVLVWFSGLDRELFLTFIRRLLIGSTSVLLLCWVIYLCDKQLSQFILLNVYFDRYSAWTSNPNQLALFLVPFPILFLMILQQQTFNRLQLSLLTIGFFSFFLMGLTVRSDALLLTWTIGFISILIFSLVFKLRIKWTVFLIMFLSFLAAFSFFKLPSYLVTTASSTAIDVAQKNMVDKVFSVMKNNNVMRSDYILGVGADPNKGSVRKKLWLNGLSVWKSAPVFGHGPGAFSYLQINGMAMEAHNLIIDILTQGGILGLFAFLGLIAWLLYRVTLARDIYSLTIILMLLVFSQAHFVLRQPVFFLYMILCFINSGYQSSGNSLEQTKTAVKF